MTLRKTGVTWISVAVCLMFSWLAVARGEEVVDLSKLSPQELGYEFVEPTVDKSTGFVVGGKNRTEDIRQLTDLAGRPISELEAVMRPAAKTEHGEGSEAGFLGKDERMLDVLARDNAYVVDELGLTHQDLARPLLVLGHYALEHPRGKEVRYGPMRLRTSAIASRGFQLSPFLDGTKSNADITIENLANGKKLTYSLLVPQMIERYGFYEGHGTSYRVDPQAIVEALELKKGK